MTQSPIGWWNLCLAYDLISPETACYGSAEALYLTSQFIYSHNSAADMHTYTATYVWHLVSYEFAMSPSRRGPGQLCHL
jgi:hypothetical protein